MIKEIGLVVCLLMVLMAYLKQSIPQGKTTQLMSAIISIFILLSIVEGIRSFDLQKVMDLKNNEPNSNVWENAATRVEEGLVVEFNSFLQNQSFQARVSEVRINTSHESFLIERVVLEGKDGDEAKRVLAARYRIGLLNIEVMNE